MPVLEAMACGRPVLVTGGGPTDEFCPPDGVAGASRRTASRSRPCCSATSRRRPSRGCSSPTATRSCGCCARPPPTAPARARARRGRPAPRPRATGWTRSPTQYADRLRSVAAAPGAPLAAGRGPRSRCPTARGTNFLATPGLARRATASPSCWRPGAEAFTEADDVALYLLADPSRDGDADARERRVLDADRRGRRRRDGIADIALLEHVAFGADLARIHAACDAYVPLHAACDGHVRLARAAGRAIVAPDAAALRAACAGRGALRAPRGPPLKAVSVCAEDGIDMSKGGMSRGAEDRPRNLGRQRDAPAAPLAPGPRGRRARAARRPGRRRARRRRRRSSSRSRSRPASGMRDRSAPRSRAGTTTSPPTAS